MEFHINKNTVIKNFQFVDNKIVEFMKFGSMQPYRKFKGFLNDKKVTGYICLNDDQVYKLEYLKY